MGDRSGGREVKGASLKKSKKNPGGVNARGKKAEKTYSGPVESAVTPLPGSELYFDCGAALLSRQFERDRDRVLERARSDGNVAAIVVWFSDVEKQHLLSEICKDNSGLCYNVVGVHPDNIDKTNKRSHETWMLKVEEIARKPECVGILSGYNLGRDVATHFAQESLLKTSCALSDKLQLSLVLHVADGESLLKCIDILKGEGWTRGSVIAGENAGSRKVILHDAMTACGGDFAKFEAAIEAGFLCAISAAGITDIDKDVQTGARRCVASIPIGQLLVCSDSPWKTPQNIPDTYLRTLRNEPSNIPSIIAAVSEAIGTDLTELGSILRANSLRAFGMDVTDNDNNDDDNEYDDNVTNEMSILTVKDNLKVRHKDDHIDMEEGNISKGKKKSKAALLQMFALNDKKKKEKLEESNNKNNSNSDSDSGIEVHVPVPLGDNSDSLHFSCHKCRTPMFSKNDVLAHALDAVRTVFKVGDEGLCKSSYFLSYAFIEDQKTENLGFEGEKKKEIKESKKLKSHTILSNDDSMILSAKYPNMNILGDTVECSVCGVKLGKYSHTEAPCPCGILVPGPAVRINATKVDFIDSNIDAQTLAARSLLESEKINLLNERENNEEVKSNKKEKKKKLKSDNQGNFSSYRNKSFVKNASRATKGHDDDENEKENDKEKDEGGSEEDSEDEKDEEKEEEELKKILSSKKKKNKSKNKNKKLSVVSDSDSDDDK